jgi:hypothetical protein
VTIDIARHNRNMFARNEIFDLKRFIIIRSIK